MSDFPSFNDWLAQQPREELERGLEHLPQHEFEPKFEEQCRWKYVSARRWHRIIQRRPNA